MRYQDIPPAPPHRLYTDKRVLHTGMAEDSALNGRRNNKMRERFPVAQRHEPVRGLNLVAPVQPSIPNPTGHVL